MEEWDRAGISVVLCTDMLLLMREERKRHTKACEFIFIFQQKEEVSQ